MLLGDRMMKLKRLILFIILLSYIQILFIYFAFNTFLPNNLLGVFFFSLAIASFLIFIETILPKKGKWLVFLIILFFSIYAIVQLNFKNFMGNYISLVQGKDGITRITEYIIQFIFFIDLRYYTILIAPFLSLINIDNENINRKKTLYYYLILSVLSIIIANIQMTNDNNIEKYLSANGPIRYFFHDASQLIFGTTHDNDIIYELPKETIESSIQPTETPNENRSRKIDQNIWNELIEAETNEEMIAIDQFLHSQNITDYNEYTGIFKGKNIITIMIEAFDYMAIDQTLTPTLYKMKTQGWFFENYYTPKYSCTTGESEFIGQVSLVPENMTCAPNDYGTNLYPYSLFNLLRNEDYDTYAFHNWYDEFYDRRIVYQNMGTNVYYNKNDLNITEYKGWPSDIELFDQAYDIIDKTKPFYAHIVTSSTHFPYDQDSWSADLHLDKINEIYPNYPSDAKRYLSKAMILDEALEHLIAKLNNDQLLEDTIILIYPDHHPLKMDFNTIQSCSYMDRTSYTYSIDHTPMIIYGASIQPQTFSEICSTFDIVPTVANLMGIDFDPRFYMGNDYFAPNKETMVIFANGDFLIEEGYYSNVEEKFYPFNDQQINDNQLNHYQILSKNKINVSSKILRNNYFYYRNFID